MDYSNQEEVNKKLIKYQRMRFYLSLTSTVCIAAVAITAIGFVAFIKPKIDSIYNQTTASLTKIQEISAEIQEADLGGIVRNVDDLTVQATEDLNNTMSKIDSVDFEALNNSINSLEESVAAFREAVDNLASPFG